MFRKDHIPELDGLRGIAVLLVLWVHLPVDALGEGARQFRSAVLPGNVGVDLFFVLSGFLITRILLVDRAAGRPLRHFMARRFLRIFPIYYLLLLLLAPWLQWQELVACASYSSNYAFLMKDQVSLLEHTWSLAIEEHFYLLWPPLAVFLTPQASRRALLLGVFPLVLVTALGVLLLGDWLQNGPQLAELLAHGSSTRFGSLGLGALLAYHESGLRQDARKPLLLVLALFGLAGLLSRSGLACTGLGPLLQGLMPAASGAQPLLAVLRLISIPAMSLGVLILAVTHTGRALPWSRLLRARPLAAIGRVSYGLYLYHFPIFLVLLGPGTNPPASRVLLALGASFAAATASFWIIERPIMRLSARFRSKA